MAGLGTGKGILRFWGVASPLGKNPRGAGRHRAGRFTRATEIAWGLYDWAIWARRARKGLV